MKFHKPESEIYIWNGKHEQAALEQTTHLAIAAHQDDVEIMAYHGIIECFGKHDKHFSAVVAANGAGSPRTGIYKDYTDTDMIEIRKHEQRKAAFVGEYSALVQLMYTSAEIKNNDPAVTNDILKVLEHAKPEIVYTHNLADKHETHVAITLRTIAAIRRLPKELRPHKMYGCEVWRALDWMEDEDKVLLNVSGRQNLNYALINVFDSQSSGGKNYGAAATGRRLANATFSSFKDTDTHTHTIYAMDLTPLIHDDSMDIQQFALQHIHKFIKCVEDKICKLSQ